MGKYSNVNWSAMSSAASKALSELSYHNLNCRLNITNRTVLSSSATEVLSKAFNDVLSSSRITGSVAVLRKKLSALKSVASKIKSYQATEKSIRNYEQKMRSARSEMQKMVYQNVIRNLKSKLNSQQNDIDNYLRRNI